MQPLRQFFCLLGALLAFCAEAIDGTCDPREAQIIGGDYTVLENGTVLQYKCPEGQYPYPTEFRTCDYGRWWNTMTNAFGNTVRQAKCQDIRCHRPVEFENGLYEPKQLYYNISQELTFECYGGYKMYGSQKRTCLPNGKWSGETTRCDDGAGHCPNPGIPIGARKSGVQYRIEYRVRYTCDRGLTLVGSKERVCQESKSWSGAEPECLSPFTFDTPEEVSSKFIASLTEAVETLDADKNNSVLEKRKIKIEKDGLMNIYLVLDASRSIGKPSFKHAQNMSIKLIEKISSYDTFPRYGIVTFATHAKELVRTTDANSNDAAWVIEQLEGMKYGDHKKKPGTNIQKGLQAVYNMMISQQAVENEQGLNPAPVATKTRHVIILLSDGNYNMGGNPIVVIRQIREFLNIGHDRRNPREDYLDVYVFAIGDKAHMERVNELASQKRDEKHAFKIKDFDELQEAFDKMIGNVNLQESWAFRHLFACDLQEHDLKRLFLESTSHTVVPRLTTIIRSRNIAVKSKIQLLNFYRHCCSQRHRCPARNTYGCQVISEPEMGMHLSSVVHTSFYARHHSSPGIYFQVNVHRIGPVAESLQCPILTLLYAFLFSKSKREGKGFEYCKGALISEYYVLTAAHCFTIDDKAEQITVKIGRQSSERQSFDVAAVHSHPLYQLQKLKDRKIDEFYDYDIALVKLTVKVKLSVFARPICLPCTAGATRALRKPHPQTTCKEHEEMLLPAGNVASFFVTDCSHSSGGNRLLRQTVHIKNSELKMACEEDAKKAKHYVNVTDVSEVVTDRFLCTGGIDPVVDPNTCKGDSGGPLIIQNRLRYVQVGVISWGVVDVCQKRLPACDKNIRVQSPSFARDFHINIFKVLPWLKQRLSDEGLDFL
nr:complement factor B [Pogona vitticeps]